MYTEAIFDRHPRGLWSYAVLARFRQCYPHSKADYLRVTHPCAAVLQPEGPFSLDLHVLGTPPAFILSQDQTLQFVSEFLSQHADSLFSFQRASFSSRAPCSCLLVYRFISCCQEGFFSQSPNPFLTGLRSLSRCLDPPFKAS